MSAKPSSPRFRKLNSRFHGRIHRVGRAVRLRQIHLAQSHRRTRSSEQWRNPRERFVTRRSRRTRTRALSPRARRLYFSKFQSAADVHRAGKCGVADDACRNSRARAARARKGVARIRRACAANVAQAERTFRRRETARGHRPRAGEPSSAAACGRTHGKSRFKNRRRRSSICCAACLRRKG